MKHVSFLKHTHDGFIQNQWLRISTQPVSNRVSGNLPFQKLIEAKSVDFMLNEYNPFLLGCRHLDQTSVSAISKQLKMKPKLKLPYSQRLDPRVRKFRFSTWRIQKGTS